MSRFVVFANFCAKDTSATADFKLLDKKLRRETTVSSHEQVQGHPGTPPTPRVEATGYRRSKPNFQNLKSFSVLKIQLLTTETLTFKSCPCSASILFYLL